MNNQGNPVSAIQCPHQDASETGQVCLHLLENKELDYVHKFRGVGMAYDLICLQCSNNPSEIENNIRNVCLNCIKEIEEEGCWDGIIGQPQVLERPSNLYLTHETIKLIEPINDEILDIQPIEALQKCVWVALTASGDLLKIDLESCSASLMVHLPPSDLNLEEEVSLYLSRNGEIAAVVNTKGKYGVVVNLNTGLMTTRLERDNYHIEHSTFPVAFFEWEGQPLLIHGTEWNRLDISDPKTGRLLTERSPTSYGRGEKRPEHYLDYFHCGLTVSPKQTWIADNGWVWSPVGIVRTWSLRRWIEENVWESEDGSSRKWLCQRWYYWDGPLCWIDDQTLAVWGYGRDDLWLIPAVCLFDVESGNEIRWFPGPIGSLVFDDYLFSFSAEHGTSVWDIATGERLLHDATFFPTSYHRGAKRFLSLLPDGIFQVSRLSEK